MSNNAFSFNADNPANAPTPVDGQPLPRVDWSAPWDSGPQPAAKPITWNDIPPYNVMTGRWNVFDKANSPFASDTDERYMLRAKMFADMWAGEDKALAAPALAAQEAEERRRQKNREAQQRWRDKQAREKSGAVVVTAGPQREVTEADVTEAFHQLEQARELRRKALLDMALVRAQWDRYVADFAREHKRRIGLLRKQQP